MLYVSLKDTIAIKRVKASISIIKESDPGMISQGRFIACVGVYYSVGWFILLKILSPIVIPSSGMVTLP